LKVRIAPILILAALLLSACSGGGGSGSQPPAANLPPTVDAGADQTAASSATVNLNGTATDSDGTIASYSWTQSSGDTVSLNNANTANASFIMPSSAVNEALTFKLSATDNLGKSTSDTVTISIANVSGGAVDITGKVTFDLVPFNTSTNGLDYSNITASASRGIVVEAIDESDSLLTTVVTDADGQYLLKVDPNINLRLRISTKMLQTTGATWDVKVTDNTNSNALYVTQGDLFNSSTQNADQSTVRNFHMASGWDGNSYSATRAAAPFAILDTIYQSMQKVAASNPSMAFPPLEIHWSKNNSVAQGKLEDGDIGTSFYSEGGKIYVLGKQDSDADEYDRHIIIHEWGHYIEDQLSRSESLGGDHGSGDRLDMRVAFSEGWGNALSAIITDDPFYRDSSGPRQGSGWSMNIESNPTSGSGWFSEDSVQSILYDLYDTNADGADNIALGLGPIYSSLTSANYRSNSHFTSIYPFIDQLKTQQPASATAINSLLNTQQIYGSGDNGFAESNNGGINSVLPIYKTATVGGNATGVCYVNHAGTLNKLGNRSFAVFDATTTGSYSFSVIPKNQQSATLDPDLVLYKSGTVVAESTVTTADSKANLSASLSSTGTYILEVPVYENSSMAQGEYCFDLQITH